MGIIQILLNVLIDFPILATMLLGYQLFRNGQGILGKPTISPGLFYTAKAIAGILFTLGSIAAAYPGFFSSFPWIIQKEIPAIQKLMSMVFLWTGNLFLIPAYYSMSIFTRVGLPLSSHVLKTSGVYRFSRNPMYFSFYFFFASCFLLIPSLFVGILIIYTLTIHHLIILKEERFLTDLFKNKYLIYKKNVPRYI